MGGREEPHPAHPQNFNSVLNGSTAPHSVPHQCQHTTGACSGHVPPKALGSSHLCWAGGSAPSMARPPQPFQRQASSPLAQWHQVETVAFWGLAPCRAAEHRTAARGSDTRGCYRCPVLRRGLLSLVAFAQKFGERVPREEGALLFQFLHVPSLLPDAPSTQSFWGRMTKMRCV